MVICDRLRALREEKKLSQGDIQKRTGTRSDSPNGTARSSASSCGTLFEPFWDVLTLAPVGHLFELALQISCNSSGTAGIEFVLLLQFDV
jgi:hypothetical protein